MGRFVFVSALLSLVAALMPADRATVSGQSEGASGSGLQWIWSREAADGPVYFRKTFIIDRPFQNPTDEAHLD
ncbi:MAG TPA: hypothetical protein PKC45_03565, partial [Gemmatales bacterium]|nr:hypothetical protein [Gemmatales bacterium]